MTHPTPHMVKVASLLQDLCDRNKKAAHCRNMRAGRIVDETPDPENVAVQQSRDDAARAIVVEEYENWSHQELVDSIIDRMSPKEILEFASETTELREEFFSNN